MNPRTKDYINVKWLHKELIERRMNAEDDERIAVDKALQIYTELIAKWRKENGGN